MSLAETSRRRPVLTLPGYRPADAAPLAACATGATSDGHRVPETVPAVRAHPEGSPRRDPRALSFAYYARTLADLTVILGASVPPIVLASRCPLPLRIGVLADFLAAYPAASPGAVSGWLRRWTATTQYRRALAAGGLRFDLVGNAVEPISAAASAHAAELLVREATRMAREAAR